MPPLSDPPQQPAAGGRLARARDRREQRDVQVHLVLADGGGCALRPSQHGLLHRRHRRNVDRSGRPVVHPGRDAVQLRGPERLHRKLLAVRPRGRVPRGEGSDGGLSSQALRFGPDVRLHSHGPHQRRVGRAIYFWPCGCAAAALCARRANQGPSRSDDQLGLGHHRLLDHDLFLPAKPAGNSRVERQGVENHDRHHHYGRHHLGLVRNHAVRKRPAEPCPLSAGSQRQIRLRRAEGQKPARISGGDQG